MGDEVVGKPYTEARMYSLAPTGVYRAQSRCYCFLKHQQQPIHMLHTTRQAHGDSTRAAAATMCWASWAPKGSPSVCASCVCGVHAHVDVSVSCWCCGHYYGRHYQPGCQGWPAHCCSCSAADGHKPTEARVLERQSTILRKQLHLRSFGAGTTPAHAAKTAPTLAQAAWVTQGNKTSKSADHTVAATCAVPEPVPQRCWACIV